MKKGKSMKQAAASWKKSGSGGKSRILTIRSGKSRSSTNGGNSRMGKRGGFNTQKIFKYVRLAALAAPAASEALSTRTTQDKINRIVEKYTGYYMPSGTFTLGKLAEGYGPLLAATVATYGIPKLASMLRGL